MIGIFDSGVGGLSVWRELAPLLPDAHMIYLADQAHLPYGPRRIEDVRSLTARCARWLVHRGCNIVVIACNTASGAALSYLRETFPQVRFVGAEPAIKPAALSTRSGVIGVLATQTTFASERYASLITRFAIGARVIEQPSPDWVTLVEAGPSFDATAMQIIEARLRPLLGAGADVLVLGCTHFPFLQPQIEQVLAAHGQAVRVIDPGPAIAREAARQYAARQYAARQYAARRQSGQGMFEFWTTADAMRFSALASRLLGQAIQARRVALP
jgi:glutamate racemase